MSARQGVFSAGVSTFSRLLLLVLEHEQVHQDRDGEERIAGHGKVQNDHRIQLSSAFHPHFPINECVRFYGIRRDLHVDHDDEMRSLIIQISILRGGSRTYIYPRSTNYAGCGELHSVNPSYARERGQSDHLDHSLG